jgi:hypothetical protein
MSDTRAYTFKINPEGSGIDEDSSIHQTSPAWVLTFVRWNDRDTLRNPNSAFEIRDPLVVENDCIMLSVSYNKGTLTPNVRMTLVQTDVNYLTALAPGDFVFVNMLNWQSEARRVANQARGLKAINGLKDGFKGMFKIQSIRRKVSTNPVSGIRTVSFDIDGFAFTEFNNSIYFNPHTLNTDQQGSFTDYILNFQTVWASEVTAKGFKNVQSIIKLFIYTFLGEGFTVYSEKLSALGAPLTQNVVFFMPSQIGSLLGKKEGVATAKDIYYLMFGVQHYSNNPSSSPAIGMNPSNIPKLSGKKSNTIETTTPCQGKTHLKPDYWDNQKSWSIINQYTNAPLNEIFSCFKISPMGNILPFIVFRQIPFTNDDFKAQLEGNSSSIGDMEVTRFMTLPRWKIHPALIIEQDIGRDEAARVNFIQYFGRTDFDENGSASVQESPYNSVKDMDDVKRNGLRPVIATSMFDPPVDDGNGKLFFNSPNWAKVWADAIMGGHLKLNGTLTCAGIVDPITIGDNLEFDGVVYHIEHIQHSCFYNKEGFTQFRTTISLSHGISIDSTAFSVSYAEMNYPRADKERKSDYNNNQILPGVSESQDLVNRVDPDISNSQIENVPFKQPLPITDNPQITKVPGGKT